MQDFSSSVVAKAEVIQQQLIEDDQLAGLVGRTTTIPRPFQGKGPVRLVVLGQDPTVQRKESRASIKTVLNLDQPGPLRSYLEDICAALGLDLARDVYATNLAKGFFVSPPTTLARTTGRDVLVETARAWLPLLREELARFPDATVLSLGEPVLAALVKEGLPKQMRHYWGWRRGWKTRGTKPFLPIRGADTRVGREIFPFVHQPTMRGRRTEFYRVRRGDYFAFIKAEAGL